MPSESSSGDPKYLSKLCDCEGDWFSRESAIKTVFLPSRKSSPAGFPVTRRLRRPPINHHEVEMLPQEADHILIAHQFSTALLD